MNENKMNIIFFKNKNNIIYVFLTIFLSIYLSQSHILYEKSKPIFLSNENYLIIKIDGIYTYNMHSNRETKHLFKNELQKNETKNIFYFKDGLPENNIFIFIKDFMYIYSIEGELIKNVKVFEKDYTNFYNIIFPYKLTSKNGLNLIYYYIVVDKNHKNNIIIDIYKYNYLLNYNILYYSNEIKFSKSEIDIYSNNTNFYCELELIFKDINKDKELICYFENKNNKNIFSKRIRIDILNKNIYDFSNKKVNEEDLMINSNYNSFYSYLNEYLSQRNNNKLIYNKRILNGEEHSSNGDTGTGGDVEETGKGGGTSSVESGEEGNGGEETGTGGGTGGGETGTGGGTGGGETGTGGGTGGGETGTGGGTGGGETGIGGESGDSKKNDFNFDFEKGQTNMTRSEIRNNRGSIMENYEKGNSYKIEGDGFEIKVSPMNEKGDKGSTSIDFLSCETKLRKAYGFNDSVVLSVFQTQTETTNERSLTNRVSYVVYDEDNNELDLSVCGDEQIRINYALRNDTNLNTVMLSDFAGKGIDILNSSDPFFNDICYTYSDGGSDIILKDRISDIYQNYSICDSGCEYESIDSENMTVSCTCEVSNDTDSDDDEDDDNTNLKNIILSLFDDSTFGVIKCYKLVFNFNNKYKNIGFMIFSVIILAHIPLYVLFFLNGINPIKKYIEDEMKKFHYIINIFGPPKKKKKILKKPENKDSNNKIEITNSNNGETDNRINAIIPNIQKGKRNNVSSIKHNNLIQETYNKNTELNDIISLEEKNIKIEEKSNKKITYFLIKIDANNSNGSIKPSESNYSLKNYEYETAIEYEKRSFWRILYIVLLAKDNLLNTFILKSPLESQPLRICILLFSYSSDLALNTLFYFSDNISDKYHYTGKYLFWFTLFNNLIISVISTLLSIVLGSILSSMTDSKSSIESEFKKEEKKMRENPKYVVSEERKSEIITSIIKSLKCLKIKMIIFVFVDLIILLFFYYFTTAFCSVYQGTQTSWITDAIVSIIIAIPIEVAIALVVTIVYKLALRYKCKLLYKISMIFA